MTPSEYAQLLRSVRTVLDRHLFDADMLRDDVAELCMKLDDTLAELEDEPMVGSAPHVVGRAA